MCPWLVTLATALAVAATPPGAVAPSLRVVQVDTSELPQVRLVVESTAAELAAASPAVAFELREEGEVRPVDVDQFDDGAVQLAVVVDTSVDDLDGVLAATVDFVVRQPDRVRVHVVDGGAPAELVTAAAGSRTDALAALLGLRSRPRSALGDGVLAALDGLAHTAAADRRVVVAVSSAAILDGVLSDGVQARLGAADTTLYGLGLGGQATPTGRDSGPAVQILPAPATEELIDAYDRVASALRHRYTLTFETRSAGPTELEVRLLGGAVVAEARVVIDLPTTRRYAAPDAELPVPEEETRPVTPSETGLAPTGTLVVGLAILLSLAGVSLLSWRSSRDNPEAAASDAPPPGWRQRAEQVHAEAGGDHATVLGLGREIAAARERAAEALRSAGFSARCAAVILAAVPIAVGAVRFLLDPAAPARFFEGPRQVVVLLTAAGLAAGGSRWLSRVARPPFRALPHHRRAHLERTAREEALTTVLDTAALHAAAGLPLQVAIQRATEADDAGIAEGFFDLLDDNLRRRDGSIVGKEPHRFAMRCALALDDGMEPSRAFFETASRVRLEQQWRILQQAEGFLVPMLVPVVACVLPASLIVALGPW